MPRIQSRLHADELQSTKQALAEAAKEVAALRQRVQEQQAARDNAEALNAALSEELVRTQDDLHSAHTMLTDVQAHYEARERGLQDQVRRMDSDIQTLEEMVQAARRREAAWASSSPSSPSHSPSTSAAAPLDRPAKTAAPCESCAKLRDELRRTKEALRLCDTTPETPPSPPARPPRPAPYGATQPHVPPISSVSPTPSPRNLYWQDQLLSTTQQAAAGFDEVRQHTHDLCTHICTNTGEGKEPDTLHSTPALDVTHSWEDATACWSGRLQHLQRAFDNVAQADAKVIGFLVLAAERQSAEIQRLQLQWAEAHRTITEVEAVLDEAQSRVHAREEETRMLRAECATLTDAQVRGASQLAAQAREIETCGAALETAREEHQQSVEAHMRQVAALTARLTQSTKVQQQATAYAHQLETALQDKQRLLVSAASEHGERQRQELLAAAKARVAQFVAQVNQSAQQLQTSLSHLPATAITKDEDAPELLKGTHLPKSAPSLSSPEPSPPGLRSTPGVSASRSATRSGTRSLSSVPYDDSILLADVTQPFSF